MDLRGLIRWSVQGSYLDCSLRYRLVIELTRTLVNYWNLLIDLRLLDKALHWMMMINLSGLLIILTLHRYLLNWNLHILTWCLKYLIGLLIRVRFGWFLLGLCLKSLRILRLFL